jgi:hypothetical protein
VASSYTARCLNWAVARLIAVRATEIMRHTSGERVEFPVPLLQLGHGMPHLAFSFGDQTDSQSCRQQCENRPY